ncbi:hypothetical protein ACVFI8_09150 [Agarivorans sp. MS3-6]
MNKDSYSTFIGAKAVAFTWIAALISPVFLEIGIEDGFSKHFYIGVGCLVLILISFVDGIRARRHAVYSDFWVCSVVPVAVFLASLSFVWLASSV